MATKLGVKRVEPNLIFFLFLILIGNRLIAADVSLSDFVEEQNLQYSFDPFRELGQLNKGSRIISFGVGVPVFILDYALGLKVEPLYRSSDGSIRIPDQTRDVLLKVFDTSKSVSEQFNITTIIIDPGHGGKDPGTIGTHYISGERLQLKEKDLVLSVSKLLYSKLSNKYPDKTIKMTRSTDVYLELEERTEIANSVDLGKKDAMIFVSVHANASLNPSASGFEVWYLPPDYRRELLDPDTLDADKKDLAPILNSVMEEEYTVESIILAQRILDSLDSALKGKSDNRGLKEESWFVVRNAKMPSILIEIGFVTNKEEAQLLARNEYLIQLSDGIYNGLVNYIDTFDSTNGFTE